jgi:hypothetical protein
MTQPMMAQSPKGWRGIVPLHSTRADVVRLLGPPNVDGDLYDFENERVHIDYSDGPCEKGRSGWNVPRDTVVSISLAPTKHRKFSALRIDEKKYRKSEDGELPGIFYYTNDAEGITISVSQGEVRNIYYNPTSKDDHLRCPCSTPSTE